MAGPEVDYSSGNPFRMHADTKMMFVSIQAVIKALAFHLNFDPG